MAWFGTRTLVVVFACTVAFEASAMLSRMSQLSAKMAHWSTKQRIMAYHTGSPPHAVFFNTRLQDRVRDSQKAFRLGDIKPIDNAHFAYAHHWDPDDGTTALSKVINYPEGEAKQTALQALINIGANPTMPNLLTLDSPLMMSKQLQNVRKSTVNIDGLSTFNQYHMLKLIPLASFVRSFISVAATVNNQTYRWKGLLDEAEVEEYINHFRHIKQELEKIYLPRGYDMTFVEDQAEILFSELIHNVGAATTALLAPLVNPHRVGLGSAISDERLQKLEIKDPIELSVGLLTYTGAFSDLAHQENKIELAKERAPAVIPIIIVKMARLLCALMYHEDVKLFHRNPELAYVHLLENFSRIGCLKAPDEHRYARSITIDAVERLKARKNQ